MVRLRLPRLYGEIRNLISDVEQTAQVYDRSQRRDKVYRAIDELPFQKWLVAVSGTGFATDAYELFAVNAVIPMLQIVYPCDVTSGWRQASLLCVTLAGAMVGQLFFGYLADKLGRRRAYFLELTVLFLATLGTIMCGEGAFGSMSIWGWLLFCRFALGIGIGGDYPISALMTGEYAPTEHRARMLASVFAFQSLGQLLAAAVALIAIAIAKEPLQSCTPRPGSICGSPIYADNCLRAVDRIWRATIGFGAVPAMLAFLFRLTVSESPRWTYDVQKSSSAMREVEAFFNISPEGSHPSLSGGEASNGTEMNGQTNDSSNTPAATGTASEGLASTLEQPTQTNGHLINHIPNRQPSPKTEQKLYEYLKSGSNLRTLFGTAGSWFLIDCCFYGLGLHANTVVKLTWPVSERIDLYSNLMQHIGRSFALTVAGAAAGSLATIFSIQKVSARKIQLYGGLASAFFLVGLGASFLEYSSTNGPLNISAMATLILSEFFFNFGPNATTFIIPAELFATKWRATCYGISAAAGKLGSIVVQVAVTSVDPDSPRTNGITSCVFGGLMLLGVILTYFCVPGHESPRHGPQSARGSSTATPQRTKMTLEELQEPDNLYFRHRRRK